MKCQLGTDDWEVIDLTVTDSAVPSLLSVVAECEG